MSVLAAAGGLHGAKRCSSLAPAHVPAWCATGLERLRGPLGSLFLGGKEGVHLERGSRKREFCWFNERTSWKRCQEVQTLRVSTYLSAPCFLLNDPQNSQVEKISQIPFSKLCSLQNFGFLPDFHLDFVTVVIQVSLWILLQQLESIKVYM